MSRPLDEKTARKVAIARLQEATFRVNMALEDLYEYSPSYAGEVESVKESIETAIKVLSGEPVE